MGLNFAFPAALWGLLGLPVVVLIHFLQSRERKEVVSTLFLLEMLPEETRRGAVFTRLRGGLQLWLQLLAVLLLTLLLSRPMWLRKESVQTVAIVVDVSASMDAFREEMTLQVGNLLREVNQTAGSTEWMVLPSDSTRPRVYRGPELESCLTALDGMDLQAGPHPVRPALVQARKLIGEEGALFYVTDHPDIRLPAGVQVIGVGSPKANTAISGSLFTALDSGEWEWEVSLVHFGPESLEKTLMVYVDGNELASYSVQVTPGAVSTVEGRIPPGSKRGKFQLEPDAVTRDNVLPFVPPARIPIEWDNRLQPNLRNWAENVMATVPETRPADTNAVLAWRQSGPAVPPPLHPYEILALQGENQGPFVRAVPTDHRLVKGLSWQGFLAKPLRRTVSNSSEEVLVWMGEYPLISLMQTNERTQLILNFDWESSNADRFPGLILLLNRFVRSIRDTLPGERSGILETRQRVRLTTTEPAPYLSLFETADGKSSEEVLDGLPDRAPDQPGFWTVTSGEAVVFRGGLFSGDIQEGDLRRAASTNPSDEWFTGRRELNSEQDFFRGVWFFLLGCVLFGAWWSGKTISPGRDL